MQVAVVRGQLLLKVTATEVLTHQPRESKWGKNDKKLLALLENGVNATKFGSFYFSHAGDMTLTAQRAEQAAADPQTATLRAWQRADARFTWNGALARPFLDAGLDAFVPTVFMGFAEQLGGLNFLAAGRHHSLSVTLIARRSAQRPGTRQWRRGADQRCSVANFVETEQLICTERGDLVSSFVQVRGSLPLLWSQTPCLQYKIPIHLAPPSASAPVFAGHADGLLEQYGAVTGINLANQTGREGVLSRAYKHAADEYATSRSGYRLVGFDFHKMCGATNYANLSLLWDEIKDDFGNYGYFYCDPASSDGYVLQRQRGVFRTNCVDTLDRTNVVQGMLGKKALEDVLIKLGLLAKGQQLPQAYPEVDRRFRVAWADHGDEISRQYAGTGAMKSSFTRTGKRDIWGLLDDGVKSVTRYYLNNFRDGEKQDALELVAGAVELRAGRPVRFQAQSSPFLPLAAVLLAIYFAIGNLKHISSSSDLSSTAGSVLSVWLYAFVTKVLSLLLAAVLIVAFLFKNGTKFVNRPQLNPVAAKPWGSE